jgi:hypothetical protein
MYIRVAFVFFGFLGVLLTYLIYIQAWHEQRDAPPSLARQSSKGILYVYGTSTPLIEQYKDRWTSRIGQPRGPYLEEIKASVRSVRKFSSIEIALATDSDTLSPSFSELFDHILSFDPSSVTGGWGEKIAAMPISPFDYTLYLDADVVICAPFHFMFDILDYFDVAASMEPPLITWKPSPPSSVRNGLPGHIFDNILHINSGVVMFRRSSEVFNMFRIWKDLHAAATQALGLKNVSAGDQDFLPAALVRAAVRFVQLPVAFNFRFHGNIAPIPIRGPVVILHTRDQGEARTCAIVNQHLEHRLQHPRRGTLPVSDVLWEKQ